MKEIISTLIRNLFKILGPLLAAKGVMDENNAEAIGGALAVIVGIVWGLFDAKQAASAKRFAAQAAGDFGKVSQTNKIK